MDVSAQLSDIVNSLRNQGDPGLDDKFVQDVFQDAKSRISSGGSLTISDDKSGQSTKIDSLAKLDDIRNRFNESQVVLGRPTI